MKIVLFSDFFPTQDNYNGPSALCFHLLNSLKEKHDVWIFSTNANKVPTPIIENVKSLFGQDRVVLSQRSLWQKFIVSKHTAHIFNFLYGTKFFNLSRYKVPKTIIHKIDLISPDLVIVYPSHLIRVISQFSNYKVIAIGPDSFALNNLRLFSNSYLYLDSKKIAPLLDSLRKSLYVETHMPLSLNSLALVGINDSKQFNLQRGNDTSFFLPHPHYRVKEKNIDFKNYISVLISGKCDVYTYSDITKMKAGFRDYGKNFKNVKFTFLGKNWKESVNELSEFLDVEYIEWVDDYLDEIVKYDVQLFPISYGVGTKGKVLDALANGLLCIGSKFAFENIAVKHKESCILYDEAYDIPRIIDEMISNVSDYSKIANKGRDCVREFHNPDFCAKVLLDYALGFSVDFDRNAYFTF